jgi:predicted nucleotidyltransferase
MADQSEPLDAQRILAALAGRGVEYVLIGGLAVQTHGHMRTTVDIDIMPAPERANLTLLAEALRELGARVLNPGAQEVEIEASMLPRAKLWQFATRHGALDVVLEAPGAPHYRELRERALEVALDELTIPVVSLDDLIAMKRASGRPVDLDDLAALTEPPPG